METKKYQRKDKKKELKRKLIGDEELEGGGGD